MIPAARVTVRLGSAQLAKLDAMAEATGISRSLVLRRLLDDVEAAAPTELSRDDLVRLLEERARAGSAPATRELLARKEQAEQLERVALFDYGLIPARGDSDGGLVNPVVQELRAQHCLESPVCQRKDGCGRAGQVPP